MLKLGRRARGHFVTLIEIRVHLIRVQPGHISRSLIILPVPQTMSSTVQLALFAKSYISAKLVDETVSENIFAT